ncbi:pilus assembly protein PilP [Candidatus Methylomicrobium oryzae]|jgi:type IV pilus assembly protein PilP|uniref:pilus assembly protein PilP n=1 Tax=Candidatus Methylomicrobium oryzae TaxID=2802053 RepID=UPI00192486D0|nr:pilus assembly protein PilP [Methylomicrobium sp. RS1]MBL1264338.1 pilus assembly protein PilP [Methylomicrobium sp. RS1]
MKSRKLPLLTHRRVWVSVFCLFGAALLSGCANEDLSDLQAFITAEKAKPKGSIEPLPGIKVVEPFIFNPDGLRDPFIPLEQTAEQAEAVAAAGSGIRPDLARPKEELEAFPLDSLRMVGTVSMKDGLWGLIKAGDSTVYRVRVGNYIGKNYGKIIRILGDRIEVMELISDKPGVWREQQASLALAE